MKAQAGMMSMTMIDPDTIALPSVSSLGVGLSTLEEFELDFSQVRVFSFSVHREMRSIIMASPLYP